MNKTRILLIEDDPDQCQKYIDYVKDHKDFYILQTTNGCRSGLSFLKSFNPDLVLLDLELNGGDGSGLDFLSEFCRMQMPNRPCVFVVTNNIANRVHARARKLGAEFIFEKDKPDYSPHVVIDFFCEHFLGQEPVLRPNIRDEKTVRDSIIRSIEGIGITAGMNGKAYLIDAIYIAIDKEVLDLKRDVYTPLAQKYQKSSQNIEKSIRNAIMKAWETTEYSVLVKHYTAQVNPNTGYPSNKEFIAEMAEKFRA